MRMCRVLLWIQRALWHKNIGSLIFRHKERYLTHLTVTFEQWGQCEMKRREMRCPSFFRCAKRHRALLRVYIGFFLRISQNLLQSHRQWGSFMDVKRDIGLTWPWRSRSESRENFAKLLSLPFLQKAGSNIWMGHVTHMKTLWTGHITIEWDMKKCTYIHYQYVYKFACIVAIFAGELREVVWALEGGIATWYMYTLHIQI